MITFNRCLEDEHNIINRIFEQLRLIVLEDVLKTDKSRDLKS